MKRIDIIQKRYIVLGDSSPEVLWFVANLDTATQTHTRHLSKRIVKEEVSQS